MISKTLSVDTMVRFSMEQHNRGEWIRASNAPALSDYSAWIYRRWEELQQGHPTAAPAPVCGSRLYFDACMIPHKQYTKIGKKQTKGDKFWFKANTACSLCRYGLNAA